ncbi:hypothetical protein Hamer_G026007, partial [Homarus americanus]
VKFKQAQKENYPQSDELTDYADKIIQRTPCTPLARTIAPVATAPIKSNTICYQPQPAPLTTSSTPSSVPECSAVLPGAPLHYNPVRDLINTYTELRRAYP